MLSKILTVVGLVFGILAVFTLTAFGVGPIVFAGLGVVSLALAMLL